MSRPVKRLPTIVVMVVFALAFIALAFVQYAKTRAGQMPPNIGQQPGAIRR